MKNIIDRIKKQEGFTLIEVMIVIAILGVLIAVLAPNIFNNVDTAARKADTVTEQRLQQLVESYNELNNGYPTNLDVLVTDGLIDEIPEAQESGKEFYFDTTTNTVKKKNT